MRWRPPSAAVRERGLLAPVAAAAAVRTAAVIPAGARGVHAKVGPSQCPVTEAGLAGLSRRNHAAAAAAIQEVMGQLFTGHHAGTDRQPGGKSARDAGADSAAAHRCRAIAAA